MQPDVQVLLLSSDDNKKLYFASIMELLSNKTVLMILFVNYQVQLTLNET